MQETHDNDEISLKELIGKVQELGHTLRSEVWGKHKLVIVLVTLLTGFGFGFKAYTTKPTYTADLTFILKESDGSGLNSIMGQLSFLGGMGTSNNTDKVLTIALSNNILERVILDTATVNGKEDRIGNHLINTYNLQQLWEQDSVVNGFVFSPTHGYKRNEAIKQLNAKLRELCGISVEKKSNIITMKVTVEDNEELALAISLLWYDNLSSYFMNLSLGPQQSNLVMLTARADSLYALLNGAERSFAVNSDKLGVINMQNKLPVGRSSRNMEMFSAMYGEVMRNKETLEFMIKTSAPSLNILDVPFAPLDSKKVGIGMMLTAGCLAGFVLSIGLIFLGVFFKNISEK